MPALGQRAATGGPCTAASLRSLDSSSQHTAPAQTIEPGSDRRPLSTNGGRQETAKEVGVPCFGPSCAAGHWHLHHPSPCSHQPASSPPTPLHHPSSPVAPGLRPCVKPRHNALVQGPVLMQSPSPCPVGKPSTPSDVTVHPSGTSSRMIENRSISSQNRHGPPTPSHRPSTALPETSTLPIGHGHRPVTSAFTIRKGAIAPPPTSWGHLDLKDLHRPATPTASPQNPT